MATPEQTGEMLLRSTERHLEAVLDRAVGQHARARALLRQAFWQVVVRPDEAQPFSQEAPVWRAFAVDSLHTLQALQALGTPGGKTVLAICRDLGGPRKLHATGPAETNAEPAVARRLAVHALCLYERAVQARELVRAVHERALELLAVHAPHTGRPGEFVHVLLERVKVPALLARLEGARVERAELLRHVGSGTAAPEEQDPNARAAAWIAAEVRPLADVVVRTLDKIVLELRTFTAACVRTVEATEHRAPSVLVRWRDDAEVAQSPSFLRWQDDRLLGRDDGSDDHALRLVLLCAVRHLPLMQLFAINKDEHVSIVDLLRMESGPNVSEPEPGSLLFNVRYATDLEPPPAEERRERRMPSEYPWEQFRAWCAASYWAAGEVPRKDTKRLSEAFKYDTNEIAQALAFDLAQLLLKHQDAPQP